MSSSTREQVHQQSAVSVFSYADIRSFIECTHSETTDAFFEKIGLSERQPEPYVHDQNGKPMSLLTSLVKMYYALQRPPVELDASVFAREAKFCQHLIKELFERQNTPGVDADTLWFALREDVRCFDTPSKTLLGLLGTAGNLKNMQISLGEGLVLPILFACMHAYLSRQGEDKDNFTRLFKAIEEISLKDVQQPLSCNDSLLFPGGEAITPLLFVLRQTRQDNHHFIQSLVRVLLQFGAQVDLHAKTAPGDTPVHILQALVHEQEPDALGLLCQMFETETGFSPQQVEIFKNMLRAPKADLLLQDCAERMTEASFAESCEIWLDLSARLLVHAAPIPLNRVAFAQRRSALIERIVNYIDSLKDHSLRSKISMRMLHAMQSDPKYLSILYRDGNKQTGVSNFFALDKTRHLEWSNQNTLMAIAGLQDHLDDSERTPEDENAILFWRFVKEYLQDCENAFLKNPKMLHLLETGEIQTWQQVLQYIDKPHSDEPKADKSNSRSANIVARILLDVEHQRVAKKSQSSSSSSSQPETVEPNNSVPNQVIVPVGLSHTSLGIFPNPDGNPITGSTVPNSLEPETDVHAEDPSLPESPRSP